MRKTDTRDAVKTQVNWKQKEKNSLSYCHNTDFVVSITIPEPNRKPGIGEDVNNGHQHSDPEIRSGKGWQ